MAIIKEMTPAEMKAWARFVKKLPAFMAPQVEEKLPWLLYRHAPTGQRVLISSYSEDGTCRMIVSERYNTVLFTREVFGVPLAELEECDLPAADEQLGAILKTQEQVDGFIREERVRRGFAPPT